MKRVSTDGFLLFILTTTNAFVPVTRKRTLCTSSFSASALKQFPAHRPSLSLYCSNKSSEHLEIAPTSTISVLSKLTSLFPVWVAGSSIVGLLAPSSLSWFSGSYIEIALGATMVMMGSTLSLDDFKGVKPSAIALGFIAQFTIMPMLGVLAALLFQLPPAFSAGLILVGCCPGGTASNLVTLIAGADVALSVAMTSFSTACASIMTPLLASWLAGAVVPLSGAALVSTTLRVVLAPVAAGMALKSVSPKAMEKLQIVAPFACVVLVALICGGIVAQNAGLILGAAAATSSGGGGLQRVLPLLGAVATMHAGGFALGYTFAKVAGLSVPVCRTVSIETGMQNSALGTVLALRAFAGGGAAASLGGLPASAIALPGALSATVHSILGSSLAGCWRRSDAKRAET